MENPVLVQMDQRLQNLVQEALRLLPRQRRVALSAHVLLEVEFKVLEHEIELVL